ncbi:single-stranded DNA-binding protein [Kibdelosporangium persicum]|uniref:Single-stranded DNA-binding protein n=1 Tax=Kibdelosporangium persicum TaxID=2698649 RepID=A0ABX2F4Q8_9PSEU|nr:single-stranded DNA-binding protein [Kibdelosporangium persicum]NRN65897.1 SsDNA binding domain [Kibdelosporangium persicum]
MSGLPDVTVAGTLTADPELRYTATGTAVANFTVAANDRRYDQKTSSWIDGDATFLRCTVWRQAAENLANSLSKGARVLVTGALRQRSYETGQGEKRYAFELDVAEVAASMRWATVTVTKATRADGDTSAQSATADSQWNSGEPPF